MIHTPRLRLRPFTMSDLDAFVAYRKEPDVARYQSWSEAFTEQDGRAFIESVSRTPFGTPGAWVNLAIEHVSTKRLIGDVAHRTEPDGTGAEIGFTLSTAAQGQGHATEAVGALCTFALESVRTLFAITDARNAPSIALLRRLGFEQAGFHAQQTLFKGELCDELRFVRAR